MQCPPDVARTLLRILETALLMIRTEGFKHRRAEEADHVHNLPGLLLDYSHEKLVYYWNVERAGFIGQCHGRNLGMYEPLWNELKTACDRLGIALSPPPTEGT